MGRFIIAVVLLLVALGVFAFGKGEVDGQSYNVKKWSALVGALGLFFLLLSTVRVIGPGRVGIPVVFGKAGTPIDSGVHFTNPLADVKRLSVRTEQYTMVQSGREGQITGDDSIIALGADGASVSIDATVLYHLNRGAASRVYADLGTDFENKVVRPTVRTAIRDAIAAYPAVDAATDKRERVTAGIERALRTALTPRGLSLESFQLRAIRLSPKLQDSIDAKVQAQQASEQQQFELSKTEQQAEIKRQEAKGIADSQAIIHQTLTPEYLQYLYIQTLEKVAASPNHSTLIMPFDQHLTPLLNLGGQ